MHITWCVCSAKEQQHIHRYCSAHNECLPSIVGNLTGFSLLELEQAQLIRFMVLSAHQVHVCMSGYYCREGNKPQIARLLWHDTTSRYKTLQTMYTSGACVLASNPGSLFWILSLSQSWTAARCLQSSRSASPSFASWGHLLLVFRDLVLQPKLRDKIRNREPGFEATCVHEWQLLQRKP